MGLLLCYRGSQSKEMKEKTYVFILMTLSKIALIFFTILDYKLYQKFKNDRNDVRFWINIVNFFIFHSE